MDDMKKIYVLLVALLVAAPLFSQNIYVEKSSGSDAVEFNALQKITFDNERINLHLNNGSVNAYSLSDVSRVTNNYGLSMSVDAVGQKAELVGSVSAEQIVVNCQAGTNVEIFSVCGAKVLSQRLGNDNGSVAISALPKGVYILRANGRTAKFLKR